VHDPSDGHSHSHAPSAEAGGASVLRASALLRLAAAGGLAALLWLGVFWATR
jgi:hypothetical protein